MADFFISHNRVDRLWAEWIAWQLETAGYEVILEGESDAGMKKTLRKPEE